jgi:redox-sensing transcriptional repressor
MEKQKVSLVVVRRLPRYYRYLGDLLKAGITKISSKELGLRMGLTASQIRQDLSCFGGFGQQGYGYNVGYLYKEIGQILGTDYMYKAIMVGAGNLGRALAKHIEFQKRGLNLLGIFDVREDVIGKDISGIPIYDMKILDGFVRENNPKIAILTLPREEAFDVAVKLKDLGIEGFWNFSNDDIILENIDIENVHLEDSLMTLCYRIYEKEK